MLLVFIVLKKKILKTYFILTFFSQELASPEKTAPVLIGDVIDPEFLRAYIAYARTKTPTVPKELTEYILDKFPDESIRMHNRNTFKLSNYSDFESPINILKKLFPNLDYKFINSTDYVRRT